jgi:hypothetical protein
MQGLFELKTPRDLLLKLKFDLKALKREPTNTYLAFNLFVTAEHMKDWVFPGKANRKNRENIEKSSSLLQICSHIANGAKHFEVEARHHNSVADTKKTGGYFGAKYFASSYFPNKYFPKGGLVIQLKGSAENQFGTSMGAIKLAESVIN